MIKYNIILEVSNISKTFLGTIALNNFSIDIREGEIHALVGPNGAGKSTFISILSGIYKKDSGQIRLAGNHIEIENPQQAQDAGIATVFQELSLFGKLSISENIFPFTKSSKRIGFINWGSINKNAIKWLSKINFDVNPKTIVSKLSLSEKQKVEITRAISKQARIIIFDEPTSALTKNEVDSLFKIIINLKNHGVTVIYVSHKLDEVFSIADRISVLRDGHTVGTLEKTEATPRIIIELMIGKIINEIDRVKKFHIIGEPICKLKNFTGPTWQNINLNILKGEIIGLAGIEGDCRKDLLRALFGLSHYISGEVYLNDRKLKITNPKEAIKAGISYVPEDRKEEGLFLKFPIYQNLVSSLIEETCTFKWIKMNYVMRLTMDLINKLTIKTSSAKNLVENLSGGNQQKVLLAKWLQTNPTLLLVDEPTRGVDVGAKIDLYQVLYKLSDQGTAVVMVSSDISELMHISDRIVVFNKGEIVAQVKEDEVSENDILEMASGVKK